MERPLQTCSRHPRRESLRSDFHVVCSGHSSPTKPMQTFWAFRRRGQTGFGSGLAEFWPCSSVNRLGFMSIPLGGDGLYPFLEEVSGLS